MRVRVVAGLAISEGRVLVQQRPAHKRHGLLWEFPGGKLEAGESEEEAVVREFQEELGVDVEVGAKVWQVEHRYPGLTVDLSLFRVTLAPGAVVEAREAARVEWVPREELPALPFCEADLEVLPRIASGEL